MNGIIEVQGVRYAYEEDGPLAVNDVTFSVEEGEFTAILGRNGSGKSTLAKLLNGLYQPEEGKVLVMGMDTADEQHIWDIRQTAGMVFQNPDNQLVATMVREDVAFGLENIGVATEEMPTHHLPIRHRPREGRCSTWLVHWPQDLVDRKCSVTMGECWNL